jgi:MoaA/NifB/PqqE/SkfB family radical SAM enzyme
VNRLAENGTSVVLGTNGTFLSADNVSSLRKCTRVEISLDAADPALNNQIRISRSTGADAWKEAVAAMQVCLAANIRVRVLTALNSINQHQLVELAALLHQIGIRDWAMSWTISAGRAARIYDELRPDEAVVEQSLKRIREIYPTLAFRYSNRRAEEFNRFYFLVLPDGQIATEDVVAGSKRTFGSALHIPLLSTWTSENFDLEAHFSKWVANRLTGAA